MSAQSRHKVRPSPHVLADMLARRSLRLGTRFPPDDEKLSSLPPGALSPHSRQRRATAVESGTRNGKVTSYLRVVFTSWLFTTAVFSVPSIFAISVDCISCVSTITSDSSLFPSYRSDLAWFLCARVETL